MEKLLDVLKVPPGKKINLRKDYDPGYTGKWINKEQAEETLAEGVQLLAEMQDKLYAQDNYALLMVLQSPSRGWQGRHYQARDVRCQPARCGRPQLQGPVGRGAGTRLPLAQF